MHTNSLFQVLLLFIFKDTNYHSLKQYFEFIFENISRHMFPLLLFLSPEQMKNYTFDVNSRGNNF